MPWLTTAHKRIRRGNSTYLLYNQRIDFQQFTINGNEMGKFAKIHRKLRFLKRKMKHKSIKFVNILAS